MPLYQYIKAKPRQPKKRLPRMVSFLLMSLGGGILVWVLWPIVSFLLVSESLFTAVIGPIPDAKSSVQSSGPLAPVVLAAVDTNNTVDYTNANVWFPTAPQKKVVTPVNSYTLSIPKFKIKNATVVIAGDDLSKSLIHYGGTGLPGEYGTAVVFGHSTLPQFFSPTSYKTIFSLLPTLTIGDEIFVTYDGVQYRYVIFEMVVTDPTDLSPLEQRFDDSYLTLITCVPPGTYWKRLNVRARLERI